MIVDDNKQLRASLAAWLTVLFPECAFLTADSGQQALKMIAKVQPAVVLMDICMLGLNGIETILEMKKRGATAEVVVLTAHDEVQYRREAEKAGARAYVLKDETPRKLPAVLKQLLSEYASKENR